MNHTDVFSKKYFDCIKPVQFTFTGNQETTMTVQAPSPLLLAC